MPPAPSPPRALLIDADAAFLAELQSQAGMDLIHLEQAAGDAHALQLLRRGSYDVVVTSPKSAIAEDLALVEEMQLVRPGLRAIVLGPRAARKDVIASLRAHAFACFSTPFAMGEIAEMIRRAVQNPDWKDGLQLVSARPDWVSLRVDCRRLTAERLVRFLSELARDVPDVTRDELLGAFREIVLNAMEHGAGFAPDQVIDVIAIRTERAIVYYVKDPGPGFSLDTLPHAAISNPPDDPLAHVEKRTELGLQARRLRPADREPRRRRAPAQREGQRGGADQAHSLAGARGCHLERGLGGCSNPPNAGPGRLAFVCFFRYVFGSLALPPPPHRAVPPP